MVRLLFFPTRCVTDVCFHRVPCRELTWYPSLLEFKALQSPLSLLFNLGLTAIAFTLGSRFLGEPIHIQNFAFDCDACRTLFFLFQNCDRALI